MSEELKPCPFCGNKAVDLGEYGPDLKPILPRVLACLNPYCPIRGDRFSIEQWKTRPVEDELHEAINQLLWAISGEGKKDLFEREIKIAQGALAKAKGRL
jgi:hypothetical protein